MSDSGRSLAAALVLGLRTPLSRVALAAGELEREAGTPLQRTLAASVSTAVSEIDGDIRRILHILVQISEDTEVRADLRTIITTLRARLAPGFEARRICWDPPTCDTSCVNVSGHTARRCALALLRFASGWARAGGAICLDVARREEGTALCLACSPAPDHSDHSQDAIAWLEALAISCGARVLDHAVPGGIGLAVLFPSST